MYVKDNKVKDGKGNYYFIGDQIVYDKEMDRMFPCTTTLQPGNDDELPRVMTASTMKKVVSEGELISTYSSTQKIKAPS